MWETCRGSENDLGYVEAVLWEWRGYVVALPT